MRTAESVSSSHPDKVSDRISDAILDECLRQDPDSRVAIESCGGHGIITITGELTTKAYVDMAGIAKKVYKECGYNDEIGVQVNVISQSPDIAQGVNTGGAGDNGIMIGYACNDNEDMIPQELYLARKIFKEVLALGYGPDGKSQITLNDDNKITRLVISVQHKERQSIKPIEKLAEDFSLKYGMDCSNELIINGTGKFVLGGFAADTGLTGRKIVQDAYGPQVPVGGGCQSGKDVTKVDRSAAYMARKIAVDYLRRYGADETIVKIAYSIGIAKPLMATIKVIGPTLHNQNDANSWEFDVDPEEYDLTPKGIIDFLDLKNPKGWSYQETAKWGYTQGNFKWNK